MIILLHGSKLGNSTVQVFDGADVLILLNCAVGTHLRSLGASLMGFGDGSPSSSVGLLVLHDDVGGYAATLTDLQASCFGPFTHCC